MPNEQNLEIPDEQTDKRKKPLIKSLGILTRISHGDPIVPDTLSITWPR